MILKAVAKKILKAGKWYQIESQMVDYNLSFENHVTFLYKQSKPEIYT